MPSFLAVWSWGNSLISLSLSLPRCKIHSKVSSSNSSSSNSRGQDEATWAPCDTGAGAFLQRLCPTSPAPVPRGILSLGVSCELRGLEGQGEGGEGALEGPREPSGSPVTPGDLGQVPSPPWPGPASSFIKGGRGRLSAAPGLSFPICCPGVWFLRALPARKENKQPPGGLDSGEVSAEGGAGAKSPWAEPGGAGAPRAEPARWRRGAGLLPGGGGEGDGEGGPAAPAPPLPPFLPPSPRAGPDWSCRRAARPVRAWSFRAPGSEMHVSSRSPRRHPARGCRLQEVTGQPGAKLGLWVCSPSGKPQGRGVRLCGNCLPGARSSKVNQVQSKNRAQKQSSRVCIQHLEV